MCGTAEWEWDADPYAYRAEAAHCKGCEQRDILAKMLDSDTPGETAQLVPREVAAAKAALNAERAEEARKADALMRQLAAEYDE